MRTLMLALIRAYRYLASPWVGGACRFWPTCSEYSQEAIERHGALKGGWMMVARIARCHPHGAGGYDPVPAQFCWRCWQRHEQDAAGTDTELFPAAAPPEVRGGGGPRT